MGKFINPFTDFGQEELPWFTKEKEECETDFECWLYLLKHMDTLDRMPFKARKAVFDKLLEVADVASLSKEERILYDEALKRYRDYKNTIDYAEERGIEKGREEGIMEGMAKGKATEQRLIATNLKKQGIALELIAQCTGLSIDEISEL